MPKELNIPLFQKMRDRIATIPLCFNQEHWYAESGIAPCGSTACFAGEAIICNAPTIAEGIERLAVMSDNPVTWSSIPMVAAELLGLSGNFWMSDKGETRIFMPQAKGWPVRYQKMYQNAMNANGLMSHRAAAAVAYLDNIILTGSLN